MMGLCPGILFLCSMAAWGAGLADVVMESPEKRLMDNLLEQYTARARPVKDPSRAIQLRLFFTPYRLDEIDSKLQTVTVKGILNMDWKDEFLVWNRTDHAGIGRVVLDQDLVWRPYIALYNSVGSMTDPIHTERNDVIVYEDGLVNWNVDGTYRVRCDMDMSRFPFDEQNCNFSFSNGKYSLLEVYPVIDILAGMGNQTNLSLSFLLDAIHIGYQWTKLGYFYKSTTFYEADLVSMEFSLHLRRKSLFYMVNVIFPSILLTGLGNCLFLIPPGTSDRVAVGTTLVLTYTVFMLHVTGNMPATMGTVPFITLFLICAMCLSALTVLASIVALRLTHHQQMSPLEHLKQIPVEPAQKPGSGEGEMETVPVCEDKEIRRQQQWRKMETTRIDTIFFYIHLAILVTLVILITVLASY